MKKFSTIMSEVAEPLAAGERRFKNKHIIDVSPHPFYVPDHQVKGFDANPEDDDDPIVHKKNYRLSDRRKGEDALVYEACSDDDLEAAENKLKKIDEKKLDKVGKEDDDVNNDGKIDDVDDYILNKRKIITKNVMKEMFKRMKTTKPAGGHFGDKEDSHVRYKKINVMKNKTDLSESTMPSNIANNLQQRHYGAMEFHKKRGNMKGYKAHFDVASKIEDALISAGSYMPIRSKRIEAASDKAFRDHPHKINESIKQLDELSPTTLQKYIQKASTQLDKDWEDTKKGKTGLSQNKVINRFQGLYKAKTKLPNESFELEEAKTRSPAYHMTVDIKNGKIHPDHVSAVETLKAKIKREDEKEGTKRRVTLQGRMGKDNPNADKYKKGGAEFRRGGHPHQRIKLGDAQHADVYVQHVYEETELNENFKTGSIKLNDGSTVIVKDQDAKLLNQMFKDLNSENKKKMLKVAMMDKHGFEEILGFAREAL